MDMRCQIAVAEIEPVRTAERGEPFQSVERFATESPALRGVDDASKRIGDDVEVGRDFQTVESNVVAGVDDDRQCAGIHQLVQTEEEFGGAYATGEGGDGFPFRDRHDLASSHSTWSVDSHVEVLQRSSSLGSPRDRSDGFRMTSFAGPRQDQDGAAIRSVSCRAKARRYMASLHGCSRWHPSIAQRADALLLTKRHPAE